MDKMSAQVASPGEYLPAKPGPVISLKTAWNFMEPRHRKAMLIVVGMSGEIALKNNDYKKQPNANFYMNQNWQFLPVRWQQAIADFMSQLDVE